MTTYHSSYRRGHNTYEVDAGDGRYVIRCRGRVVAHSEALPEQPLHQGVSDDTAFVIFAMEAVRHLARPGDRRRH